MSPADERWYAVWTRSQCEPKVEHALRAKRFDVFLPRLRVPSRRRDRRVVLERPLFPSYVFVRFVPSRAAYLGVAGIDGVVRILGERWDALHPVPETQLAAIRRVVAHADGVRPAAWLGVGDRVEIVHGALGGLTGRVRERRGVRATVVLNVDLLRRGVAVEVATDALRRV